MKYDKQHTAQRKATLRDIAQAAGVSATAVSVVLNGKPNRFAQTTCDHIRRIAQSLNYVPNQSARNLTMRSSKLMALIIPDIENHFFSSLAKRLEEECKHEDYSLLIVNTNDSVSEQSRALQRMRSLGIDGLFLVPCYDSNFCDSHESQSSGDGRSNYIQDFNDIGCPVIFIDRVLEEFLDSENSLSHNNEYLVGQTDKFSSENTQPDSSLGSDNAHKKARNTLESMNSRSYSSVSYDNEFGGRLAARAFLEAGHTNIGIIGLLHQQGGDFDDRYRGFIDECKKNGVEISDSSMVYASYRMASGYEKADILLNRSVSAVFCGNDLLAVGFARRVHERGMSIPDDISLIGYDDIIDAFGVDFNVTTIHQDTTLLARQCYELMMQACHDPQHIGRKVMLIPHIVNRGTVKQLD